MSVAEIIRELPKLKPKELEAVRLRLRELENSDATLFLHESADMMFQDMDKHETKNAKRKAR